jgi:hypothetical protein
VHVLPLLRAHRLQFADPAFATAAIRAGKLSRLSGLSGKVLGPGHQDAKEACAGSIVDALVLAAPGGHISRGGISLRAPFASG